MNLSEITTKCWILALFVRDDGERFLLGDGWYDFKDSLQHFQPNTIANDVVELQGTDGQLLAGQVRRSSAQAFDGYIGDATISKAEIEKRRRAFLSFFQTKHFYTVVYIFADGTSIDRKRGYLVDAPSVPEMWQKFPEYHVSLNFENVNYYEYAEDSSGNEIFAHSVLVNLTNALAGGLVWDEIGAVSEALQWANYQTLTGDYITISDGLDSAPLSLLELDGNAEQTTYSGKNLFDRANAAENMGLAWATGATFAETKSISSGSSSYITASAGDTFSTNFNACVFCYDSAKTYLGALQTSQTALATTGGGNFRTFTLPDGFGISFIRLTYRTSLNGNVDMTAQNIMVNTGSTVLAYEPYVGGTASPNPDYPQAIDVVTGEQVVKVEGKNLFDKDNHPVLNNYYPDGNGAMVSGNGNKMTWVQLQPNTTYTMRQTQRRSNTTRLVLYPSAVTSTSLGTVVGTFLSGQDIQQTFTTTATNYWLGWVYFNSNASGSATEAECLGSIQLELGSQATSYEPYTSQSQEINLGKNLLTPRTGNTQNGMTGTVNADGSIHITGTATSTWANIVANTSEYLPSGTYVFSTSNDNLPCTIECQLQMTDNSWLTMNNRPVGVTPEYLTKTYTLPIKTIRINTASMTVGDSYDFTIYPMIQAGALATTYAPYFTPIELAKIGTYQDRIYKDEDKWYIEKQVGKVVLDGTEAWTRTALTSGARYFAVNNNLGLKDGNSDGTDIISERFIGVNYGTYYSAGGVNGVSYSFNNSNHYIQCFSIDGTWASGNDFKTWLTTHPNSVYYILATPTTTEITDETLLEQLEHIYSLYEGVNHISITPTAGAQGTMKISYASELNPGGGFVWEDGGGGGGATTVNVIGVGNAEPIWTIIGPATNPTLTNITTGKSITWNGTVPNGQKLVIDMGNQTAELNGANVYSSITGDWLELKPGANKLTYTALGGATDPSTLEWNGVVG